MVLLRFLKWSTRERENFLLLWNCMFRHIVSIHVNSTQPQPHSEIRRHFENIISQRLPPLPSSRHPTCALFLPLFTCPLPYRASAEERVYSPVFPYTPLHSPVFPCTPLYSPLFTWARLFKTSISANPRLNCLILG